MHCTSWKPFECNGLLVPLISCSFYAFWHKSGTFGYSLESWHIISSTKHTNVIRQQLRWSRGSVLAFGTQVRGLKPDRSRWNFPRRKNPQHSFLRRESKAVCPCRRFTACKRSLNIMWWSGIFRQNSSAISRPWSSSFHY